MKKASIKKGHKAVDGEYAVGRVGRGLPSVSGFVRSLSGKYNRPLVTDPFAFLRHISGRRAGSELPGMRGDRVYTRPGHALHKSFYTWIINSVLSLTVNRLEQRFGIWLNQTPTAQTLLSHERKPSPAAQAHRRDTGREVFLYQPAPGGGATRGSGAAPSIIERGLRSLPTVYVKDAARPGTPFSHPSATYLISTLRAFESSVRTVRRVAASVDATSLHVDAVTRMAEAARRFEIRVFNRLTAPPPPTWKTREVYVASPESRAERGGGVEGFVSRPPGTVVPSRGVLPAEVAAREAAAGRRGYGMVFLSPAVVPGRLTGWFEQRRAARPHFLKAETAFVSPTVSVVFGRGASADDGDDAVAPPLNRDLAARTALAVRTIRAYEPTAAGRRDGPGGGLTFLRREEQMRPPAQSYAFARPVHPAPSEEPAVLRVREMEVEEVVRKEVATAMQSRSLIDSLTRSDYSRIADHVYSSLVRQLLIDKERGGLRR